MLRQPAVRAARVPMMNHHGEQAGGKEAGGLFFSLYLEVTVVAMQESQPALPFKCPCSSHSILCFALRTKAEPVKTVGKLSFIDLAGSERGAGMHGHAWAFTQRG